MTIATNSADRKGRCISLASDYLPKKMQSMDAYTYQITLGAIRGYKDMKKKADDLIDARKHQEVKVQSNSIGNPTARIAEEREELLRYISAVDKAFSTIPEEYRPLIKKNIAEKVAAYKIAGAHPNTIYTYRKRVIIETAYNLKLIDDRQYRSLKK